MYISKELKKNSVSKNMRSKQNINNMPKNKQTNKKHVKVQ